MEYQDVSLTSSRSDPRLDVLTSEGKKKHFLPRSAQNYYKIDQLRRIFLNMPDYSEIKSSVEKVRAALRSLLAEASQQIVDSKEAGAEPLDPSYYPNINDYCKSKTIIEQLEDRSIDRLQSTT